MKINKQHLGLVIIIYCHLFSKGRVSIGIYNYITGTSDV